MNNVKRSIGWCDYTWNPVTGCPRGCYYCYARKLHQRFHSWSFNEIKFWNYRLKEPLELKTSSKIFVGSNTDIEYWSDKHKEKILDICSECNWHTFMFLTKNYKSYHGYSYSKNIMLGCTFTCESPLTEWHQFIISKISQLPRSFLSIEPILGTLKTDVRQEELVIVGAMTGMGKKNVIPQKDWIQSIKDHVPAEKIFWKKNIQKFL